jgi:hypothetical protein
MSFKKNEMFNIKMLSYHFWAVFDGQPVPVRLLHVTEHVFGRAVGRDEDDLDAVANLLKVHNIRF